MTIEAVFESIGYRSIEHCVECNKGTSHKIISYNRYDNPAMECAACGLVWVDQINEEDGL